MYSELTNLLPEDRLRNLRRDYFLRLLMVACGLITALIIITGIFLMPAYVYLHAEVEARTIRLAALELSLKSGDESALQARLTTLSKDAARLASLGDVPAASSVIRATLQVPRPGIVLVGFTVTPAQAGKTGTLLVTGTADTRDHLRAYQLALLEASFVKAADLPISAYAKDTDIDFTITVTLTSL
ncbi:MAG TPA: hypothetical protein VM103_02865 [Candidatus Paceibacterota bacterium]|nr:hypothetical protein [Candidatus Paceibacterota bacterium]